MLVELRFCSNDGTWSDQRHLTPKHVEKLRQLVEAPTAQKASDQRYARIVPSLFHPPSQHHSFRVCTQHPMRRSVRTHRTELPDPKRHSVSSYALFGVKHRI